MLLTTEASLSSPFLDIKKTKAEQKSPNHTSRAMFEILYQMGAMYCFGRPGEDIMGLHPFHLRIPPALSPATEADMLRVSLPY